MTTATPHYSSIMLLTALGIISGSEDGRFDPNGDMTRAEYAKMLALARGLQASALSPAAVSQSPFRDVPPNRWYTGYVDVAAANGIVHGYPDGTFQPHGAVNFAEAVTELVRALGYPSGVPSDAVGSWPSGYIAVALKVPNLAGSFSLLSGVSSELDRPLSRADAARLVVNALYSVLYRTPNLNQGAGPFQPRSPSGPRTLLERLGYHDTALETSTGAFDFTRVLFYPGKTATAPPVPGNYQDIVTGISPGGANINDRHIQIASLTDQGSGPPVLGDYALAPMLGLVGASTVANLLGRQVSFVTNRHGAIVFIDAVTPPSDVLRNAALKTPLSVAEGIISAKAGSIDTAGASLSRVELQAADRGQSRTYRLALCADKSCAVGIPGVGTYAIGGSTAGNRVTAVLNPDGSIIALINDGVRATGPSP